MLSIFAENYIQYNKSINKLQLGNYYTNNSKISDAFVISLDKDINRYRETITLLMDLNTDYIRFPAIYGKGLKHVNKGIFNKFNISKLSNGEIGCALSHICLYTLAMTHPNPDAYTLIMEDDVSLQHPIPPNKFHQKLVESISYNPDMVYLGKCFENCANMQLIKNDVYYGYMPVCFHSYMIKNSFAKKVMEYINSLEIINKPIDVLVGSLLKPKKVIVFHPSLFIQNIKHISNLRERESQIHNNTECVAIIKNNKKIEKFNGGNEKINTNVNENNNKLIDFIKNYVNNTNNMDLLSFYNTEKSYDSPFIISLKKDIDKYTNAKKILGGLDFEPIRMDAIYGKDLRGQYIEICDLFSNLSDPEIGCFVSHLIVIYIISKHKNKDGYSIIFEDDIMVKNNDYVKIKNKILDVMKYNANMVYLGKCLESCVNITPIDDNSDIFYGYRPLCLHAYMIKNSFAKQIIDYIKLQNNYILPIDRLILKVAKDHKDIIVFHPSLFYQNINYDSNLRGKFLQQFNDYECVDVIVFWHLKIILCVIIGIVVYYYFHNMRKNI